METVQRKIFECKDCDFRTIDNTLFDKHKENGHIVCDHCEFKTSSVNLLNLHKKTKHGVQRKRKANDDISFD